MTHYLLLFLGLGILIAGAEILVRGASAVALRFGLSQLVVGLTVVAFGTSAPELAVAVKSSLAGQGGIAMGNVIGSNIFNVALILGLTAMVCPLTVEVKIIKTDMPLMLLASILFVALLMTGGGLQQWEGGLLFAALVVYLAWSVIEGRKESKALEMEDDASFPAATKPGSLLLSIALILGGLAMLVLGARLLVDNATIIALNLGVSETVIGLTIVAGGTSLPELATSMVAAARRRTELAVGNIVGSNIFNVLGIAGAASLVAPIEPDGIRWLDVGAMLFTSLLLLPLMWTGSKLVRWEGGVLLICFLAYMWQLWPK